MTKINHEQSKCNTYVFTIRPSYIYIYIYNKTLSYRVFFQNNWLHVLHMSLRTRLLLPPPQRYFLVITYLSFRIYQTSMCFYLNILNKSQKQTFFKWLHCTYQCYIYVFDKVTALDILYVQYIDKNLVTMIVTFKSHIMLSVFLWYIR